MRRDCVAFLFSSLSSFFLRLLGKILEMSCGLSFHPPSWWAFGPMPAGGHVSGSWSLGHVVNVMVNGSYVMVMVGDHWPCAFLMIP